MALIPNTQNLNEILMFERSEFVAPVSNVSHIILQPNTRKSCYPVNLNLVSVMFYWRRLNEQKGESHWQPEACYNQNCSSQMYFLSVSCQLWVRKYGECHLQDINQINRSSFITECFRIYYRKTLLNFRNGTMHTTVQI